MNLLKSMLIAVSMYSRIPVPQINWEKESMKYAMCFFPLIGAIIGGLVFFAGWIMNSFIKCGDVFRAAVYFLIPVFVTGGIHLDGLADTADALCSYGEREKKLEILKDPHIGAFGVIWLCCYFIIGLAVWSEADMSVFPAAVLIFVLSRSLSGLAVVIFPAAKNSGLLRTFQDAAHKKRVGCILMIWTAAAAAGMFFLGGLAGAAASAAALAVFAAYYKYSKKIFGGITGDLAGCFLQVCELITISVLIACGGIL